ncbi:MAG: Crp/Fnr family transcriptional regulator [Candidatus Cybelea sp.]
MLSRQYIPRGATLYEVGAKVEHLYFIESGLVSVVKPMQDGRTVEIGSIGREGVAVPSAVFDTDHAIMESVVQVPVTALRVNRDDFKERLASDNELSGILHRYSGALLDQLTQSAACNTLHSVEHRYSRWLLVAHDSALSNTFPVTHESLAMLLGVRRASVSSAAVDLRKRGLIQYSHGELTITDRAGLERMACECYAMIRDQVEGLR